MANYTTADIKALREKTGAGSTLSRDVHTGVIGIAC